MITLTLLLPLLSLAEPTLMIHQPELVSLKAGLTFLRCVPPAPGEVATCRRAEVAPQAILVKLAEQADAPGISGETTLKAAQDGMAFEATIAVSKTTGPDGGAVYKVEAYLDESAGDDASSFDFVGRAIVKRDIGSLNDILWTGKALSAGNVTLTPFLSLSR